MSKLDDIFEYDVLSRIHGETKAIAKGKIKRLFLELVNDKEIVWEHPNGHTYIDSAELIKEIEAL